MTFIFVVVSIVLAVMVLSLRGRVEKLEKLMQNRASSDVVPAREANVSTAQKPVSHTHVSNDLRSYVMAETARGAREVDIVRSLTERGWKSDIALRSVREIVPPVDGQAGAIPVENESDVVSKFIDWCRDDWLLKLGALLLLIGFGWLATYAFMNNWIGPMGRITLGIGAGMLFIVLGWWRIRTFLHQGSVFLVLGSTTVLLTVYAAREVYGFFTPLSALALMFLSTAFVALASIKYKNTALALSSLILAGIAPLLTDSPNPDLVGLFAYLMVVVVGALWIVFMTEQRALTLAALVLVTLYSLPHLVGATSAHEESLLLFAYGFAGLFFLTNAAGIVKLKGKSIKADLITAAGNGLFLLAWIFAAVPKEWQSLVISAWMVVFLVGAFMLFRVTRMREAFYVYAGIGIAMLAAATAAELDGAALTVAYTFESVVVALLAYALMRDVKVMERMSLLLIGPAVLSFQSVVSSSWNTSVFNEDFFVLLLVAASFCGLGWFFLEHAHSDDDEESKQFSTFYMVIGSLFFHALVWLSLHAAIDNSDTATMVSLLWYTIVGLAAYIGGLMHGFPGMRYYGGVLLLVVVARLLIVDIWSMELTGRILTFFGVGALLISTAFLGRKKREVASK